MRGTRFGKVELKSSANSSMSGGRERGIPNDSRAWA